MAEPIGHLYTRAAGDRDWLIAADLDESALRTGPYSVEQITAEIVAQLAWRLRGPGRPAFLTEDPIAVPTEFEQAALSDTISCALQQPQYTFRVTAAGASIVLPGTLPALRSASEQLPMLDSVIYPRFPDTDLVMTVVEYSEGIVVRAPPEIGLRAVLARIANVLDLSSADARLTAVEPGPHMDRVEAIGRRYLALLNGASTPSP